MPRKRKTASAPETEAVPEHHNDVEESAPAPVDARAEVVMTQTVAFIMDGQHYALPIESVQEIQQIVEFTAVPGTAPALVGMIDLRGSVVPLIDLRLLLGLERVPYHLDTPLVFAHASGRLVAFIVDEVEDVIDMTGLTLQAPSSLYALSDRLIGVARIGDGLLFILDPERLVPADALVPDAEIADGDSR